MNKYGINNITDEVFNFNFDKYYKNLAIKLKSIDDKTECDNYRDLERNKLGDYIDVEINIEEVKSNLINIIQDKDSAKFFWILYSKYDGSQNYIDKISNILKKENEVIRGGTNTYKMNGWMCHTLYVYQIVNFNIPHNIELINYSNRTDIKNQINELHNLYNKLTPELKFILKIFTLIHDIGVIEDVRTHPKSGVKYVEKVIEELGINEEILKKNNINISLDDFNKILKALVKHHILITLLSTERSDRSVEEEYKDLINNLPDVLNIKEWNSIILFLFAYGDIIGVDEKLMNESKFNRVKEGFKFFNSVIQNKIPKRDKRKVAIERICDIVGIVNTLDLENNINEMLKKHDIQIDLFIENMYKIKFLAFAAPLMKTLNNVELTITIFNKLFEVISTIDSQEAICDYTIYFSPDKHEKEFVTHFTNENFFECLEKMMLEKINQIEYKSVKIDMDLNSKELTIRII